MTLEQLRIFIVVAEHEHVTRASYELDMVQSAVSKAIAALEGETAIRLFDRIGRNIRLTPLGALFVGRARDLLDHAGRLESWTHEVGTRSVPTAASHLLVARAPPPPTAFLKPIINRDDLDRKQGERICRATSEKETK